MDNKTIATHQLSTDMTNRLIRTGTSFQFGDGPTLYHNEGDCESPIASRPDAQASAEENF
jgi:hypothetical protein